MVRVAIVLCLSAATIFPSSAREAHNALAVYAVDVEGGKATLLVSPSGESLLIDTGNIGVGSQRDADRIMAAIEDAGLRQIDHLVTTHWHRDHVGAMPLLAARIPILELIDHGANVQPDVEIDAFLRNTYPRLYAGSKHVVAKAGDRIPIAGIDVRVVTSRGEVIGEALPGGGAPNRYCAGFTPARIDGNENPQSIGIAVAFGRFRLLDLGDLTADKEFELMCPFNRIGTVDLFMVSHHGQPSSNSRALVHAIESRVAVMNNGTRKGGQPAVMEVIHSAPGLEDLWQLHFSQLSGQEYAAPGLFIANYGDKPWLTVPVAPMSPGAAGTHVPRRPVHDGTGHWIKVSAEEGGSFTVVNTRNGFSKSYRARHR